MGKVFFTLLRREGWQNMPQTRAFLLWLVFFIIANLLVVAAGKMGYLHTPDMAKYNELLEAVLLVTFLMIDMTLLLLMFFLSLDGFVDERKQHNLLFWRSLPVSDELVAASKLFFIVVLLPLLAILTIMLSQTLTLAIQSFVFEAPVTAFSGWWQQLDMVSMWGEMSSVLVGQTLWYFPVIAWFLLCSAWAPKSSPYIPAFLIPLLLVVGDKMLGLQTAIPQLLAARTPFASPVGLNMQKLDAIKDNESAPLSSLIEFDLWPLITDVQMWIGLIVGVGFMLLAARIRRWRGDSA